MSLRLTTLFIILMTFVGLIVVLLGSLNAILPPYFQRQEKSLAEQASQSGLAVIQSQLTLLEQIGKYLFNSLDTYRMPTPQGTQGLVSDIPDQTLLDFQINLIAFIDPQSDRMAGKWLPSGAQTSISVPTELTSQMVGFVSDRHGLTPLVSTAVIVNRQEPILVAAISPAAAGGSDSGGYLFVGRSLDAQTLEQLTAQNNLQLQIVPFGSSTSVDDYSYIRSQLLAGETSASMVLGNDQIAGFTNVLDLQGDPSFLIEVIQNRTLYQGSQAILNYLIISLVSSTAIFSLMVFLFVEYFVVGRLTRLNREVQHITVEGSSTQRTTPKGKDEIANLGRNINAMLARLESAQQELAESYQQVKEGRKRLENLSHRLVDIQEEERRRIAIELHDEIGQSLTGLKLKLAALPKSRNLKSSDDLEKTLMILNNLIDRVRKLSLDLRPAMLDDLGLLPTLLWYIDQYRSQTGIQVDLQHSGIQKLRFSNPIETAAYRIIQEGLTNIARHAAVKKATIKVVCRESTLHLEVSDKGSGFEPELVLQSGTTTGLSGMRERISTLGGELRITASPGKGTRLQVDLPLKGHLERRKRDRVHPAG
jgi:signal transduction histidine kinase